MPAPQIKYNEELYDLIRYGQPDYDAVKNLRSDGVPDKTFYDSNNKVLYTASNGFLFSFSQTAIDNNLSTLHLSSVFSTGAGSGVEYHAFNPAIFSILFVDFPGAPGGVHTGIPLTRRLTFPVRWVYNSLPRPVPNSFKFVGFRFHYGIPIGNSAECVISSFNERNYLIEEKVIDTPGKYKIKFNAKDKISRIQFKIDTGDAYIDDLIFTNNVADFNAAFNSLSTINF